MSAPRGYAQRIVATISLWGVSALAVPAAVQAPETPLTGPWPVYDGVLLDVDEAIARPADFEVRFPVEFRRLKLPSGRVLPRFGAYTVLVSREIEPSAGPLGIALSGVWGASSVRCRVWREDGTFANTRYDMGSPSVDPAESRSLQRWGVMPLPPGNRLACAFQFANYESTPGLRDAPVLGDFAMLRARWDGRVGANLVLFGILVAFTALHLILNGARRDRSYVYFAQMSASLASRALVMSRVIEALNPGANIVHLMWGFDVGAIPFAGAGAVGFLSEILGHHMPRRLRRPLYVTGIALTFVSFFRWVFHAGDTILLVNELYLGVVIVLALRALYRALRARDVPGIEFLALGLGFAMCSALYEMFAARRMLPDVGMLSIGIVAFVTCQGLLLARRSERMHEATEHLATQLEEKNRDLARADAMKDAFVAATSHELKTPLHGMIGLMEGVREQLSAVARASIDLAISSGRRLDTQISGLLDFAKLRRDELTLERRPLDTAALVRSVVEATRLLARAKALTVTERLAPGLIPIDGDEARVRQVLFHLLGNAMKFTERGTLEVAAESIGSVVQITVRDTGCGIAPENLDRVFDAFTQEARVDTRTVGGTGLGLAISKRLVELHGGTLVLHSTLGEGTTATLTLPGSTQAPTTRDQPGVDAPLPLEYSSAQLPPSEGDGVSAVFDRRSLAIVLATGAREDRLSILAVDDDPVNQRVLETQLRPVGYRVVVARDGVDAIEVYDREGPFDLVLLDVMMPRMSGLEALVELRARASQAELPVILLTAKQQQQDVLAGFDAGANDYLTKPFSKKELLARIETHLTVAKTNQALRRFVPQEFLEALGRKRVTEVRLGDSVERTLAILFGDIRNFTTISEGLGPEATFRFVNECLARITPFVRDHGGFVDKFIGDAVLALFPESPSAAVDAAIAIQQAIDDLGVVEGQRRFEFGIGIHVGPTMMGTIGDERRFEATVISDAVNQAARIEGMTKHVGARVLVSGEVAAALGDARAVRPLGLMRAVGRDKPIAVVEVIAADPPDIRAVKLAHAGRFAEAVGLVRVQRFAEAHAAFSSIHAELPEDGPTAFFLATCEEGLRGASVVVDGVVVLTRK